MTERAPFSLLGSVGTDHHPFPRFLEWVTIAKGQLGFDAVVQRGATPEDVTLQTVDYMSATELEQQMAQAAVVVCHGGPGTMSLAIRCGHRPVVIARDPRLGEHIDDHQQRYTARLAADDMIDLPTTVAELTECIRRAAERPRMQADANDHVNRAVDQFTALIDDLESGRLPRRRWRDRLLVRRSA